MLLSLSGFLFEDEYRRQSLPFPHFCALAHDAGYDGIELRRTQIDPDASPARRRETLAAVRDAGLTVTCLTARGMPAGGAARDHFFDRYLGLCEDLRCPLLKVGGEPDWLRQAAARSEPKGVALAANNHLGGPFESVAGTHRVLGEVDHPNFGLLYDPAHLTAAGQDCVAAIEALLPRVRNLLVQSMRRADDDERAAWVHGDRRYVHAPVDDPAVQPWAAILRAFRGGGYDGPITVIENGWDVSQREEVARRCAACLRDWWDAVAAT